MKTKMLRITLNDTEIEFLKRLACTAPGRISQRAHFVLLSHQGDSPATIAQRMFKAENTVKHWLRQYQTHGIDGLQGHKRPGRGLKHKHLRMWSKRRSGSRQIVSDICNPSGPCFCCYCICGCVLALKRAKARSAVRYASSVSAGTDQSCRLLSDQIRWTRSVARV